MKFYYPISYNLHEFVFARRSTD